jgi:opacity protein-like surface antigen
MHTTSRRHRPEVLAAVVLAVTLSPVAATAQQAAGSDATMTRRPWTITPYVGVSRHSPVGHLWGLTPDRRHLIVGVHATVPVLHGRRWTIAYAPEAIPLIVVSNNPEYREVSNPETGATETVEAGRSNVTGLGFSPIALEVQVHASRRVGLYGGGTMGGLWFARNVPVVDARSFNFTFDFGGGVRFRMNDRSWLRLGYKFHHLSNAKTAPSNPGVDGKVFLVGLERAIGRSM